MPEPPAKRPTARLPPVLVQLLGAGVIVHETAFTESDRPALLGIGLALVIGGEGARRIQDRWDAIKGAAMGTEAPPPPPNPSESAP